tara:strand:+ start:2927 stop:6739 length:3813 start_codon:yes stop_codon:yes gene_type:complete
MVNAYLDFIKDYRSKNPSLSQKEATKKIKELDLWNKFKKDNNVKLKKDSCKDPAKIKQEGATGKMICKKDCSLEVKRISDTTKRCIKTNERPELSKPKRADAKSRGKRTKSEAQQKANDKKKEEAKQRKLYIKNQKKLYEDLLKADKISDTDIKNLEELSKLLNKPRYTKQLKKIQKLKVKLDKKPKPKEPKKPKEPTKKPTKTPKKPKEPEVLKPKSKGKLSYIKFIQEIKKLHPNKKHKDLLKFIKEKGLWNNYKLTGVLPKKSDNINPVILPKKPEPPETFDELQPSKPVKDDQMGNMKISERDEFYKLLDIASKGTTRGQKKFIDKYGRDLMEQVFGGQSFGDFYSTPAECLENPTIKKVMESGENFLEGTSGLGAIIHQILKVNKTAKITGIELNRKFVDYLKKNFEKGNQIKIEQGDFLKKSENYIKNGNRFDSVIMNPPFSNGGDKQFYYDFLFQACGVLRKSRAGNFMKDCIFICPSLSDKTRKNDTILLSDLVRKMSNKKFEEVYNRLIGKKPNKNLKKYITGGKYPDKDEDLLEEQSEDFDDKSGIYQIELFGKCKGFGGTGITADMYYISIAYEQSENKDKSNVKFSGEPDFRIEDDSEPETTEEEPEKPEENIIMKIENQPDLTQAPAEPEGQLEQILEQPLSELEKLETKEKGKLTNKMIKQYEKSYDLLEDLMDLINQGGNKSKSKLKNKTYKTISNNLNKTLDFLVINNVILAENDKMGLAQDYVDIADNMEENIPKQYKKIYTPDLIKKHSDLKGGGWWDTIKSVGKAVWKHKKDIVKVVKGIPKVYKKVKEVLSGNNGVKKVKQTADKLAFYTRKEIDKQDFLYLDASEQVYKGLSSRKNLMDFKYVESVSTKGIAFYKNYITDKQIVAFRGTKELADFGTDYYVSVGSIEESDRFKKDKKHLEELNKSFRINNNKTTFCGHSLGGKLALSFRDIYSNVYCVVFNSGQGADLSPRLLRKTKVYNIYGDAISVLNFVKHPNNSYNIKNDKNKDNSLLQNHYLNSFKTDSYESSVGDKEREVNEPYIDDEGDEFYDAEGGALQKELSKHILNKVMESSDMNGVIEHLSGGSEYVDKNNKIRDLLTELDDEFNELKEEYSEEKINMNHSNLNKEELKEYHDKYEDKQDLIKEVLLEAEEEIMDLESKELKSKMRKELTNIKTKIRNMENKLDKLHYGKSGGTLITKEIHDNEYYNDMEGGDLVGGHIKNAGWDSKHPRLSRNPNWYEGRGKDRAENVLKGIEKGVSMGAKILPFIL